LAKRLTSGSPSLANNRPNGQGRRRMRDPHDVSIPVCSCAARSNHGYPKSGTSSPKAVNVKLTNLTAALLPNPGQRSRSLNRYGSESRCRSFPKNTGSSQEHHLQLANEGCHRSRRYFCPQPSRSDTGTAPQHPKGFLRNLIPRCSKTALRRFCHTRELLTSRGNQGRQDSKNCPIHSESIRNA